MIASLGMYDRPETAASNDALWAGIRKNLGYGPLHLDRTTTPMQVWQSPDLLFSQTCGMPYRSILRDSVQLIGTPDYGLSDVPVGYYYSVFVVRRDAENVLEAYKDRLFAYNEAISQSGWAAPQIHAHKMGFQFENILCSGGHLASAAAVANRQADIAALDVISWLYIEEYEGFAKHLKVIQTTAPTPGLPFITAAGRDVDQIYDAVALAIDRLLPVHRDILRLTGIVHIGSDTYLNVATPARP